jgi:hypothetical protein
VGEELSKETLQAAHCWEAADRVPKQPDTTAFRRRLRYHQARWRDAHGHPIGTQPIVPRDGKPSRLLGSRLPLDYARATGANFVTAAAHEAVKARLAVTEPHQMLDAQRLWADLLSSMPLCFNLFGDLAADPELADRAVRAWWPDVPGRVREVRFEHSPGRLDPAYLGNLSAFDVAVVLDLGGGASGILGVETKYHEVVKRELPKPERLPRYLEITERSGLFTPAAVEAVNGSELLQIWLDHLLVLSTLQHPSGAWRWGRFVVVHPAGNTAVADACARYRALLVDDKTFAAVTIEELLDAGALPASTVAALRERYLPT